MAKEKETENQKKNIRKKPSIANKVDEIFQEGEEELGGELFDINAGKGLVKISIKRLVPNPNQPRKTFYENTISELAESIKEHGVLSPIIVRPSGKKYEIAAGERCFKASRQAGLKEIPALIRKVSNGDARIISLIENIQREDLNDIDRASALRELKLNLKISWDKIAKRLGLSKRRVLDLVGLLDLPEEIKEDIRQKKITERHGRALRQLLDKAEILRGTFNFIKEKKLTGEQTQELAQVIKSEPRFTIEDCFNKLSQRAQTGQKPRLAVSPLALFATESKHLSKILDKVLISELSQPERNILKEGLREIQKKINELLDKIKI